MKDSEFIELLNLYLDHEISAADAARLEAEVQTHAARRRIYQQYCRMHKACTLVASDFQTTAEPVEAADRKVVAFDLTTISAATEQRQRINAFYTFGTFAAVAACVAIVFIGRSRQETKIEMETVSAPALAQIAGPAGVNPDLRLASMTEAPASLRGTVSLPRRAQPTLVGDPLLLSGSNQVEAIFTSRLQPASSQLAWIEAVQLAPLQPRVAADELHFAATLRPEGRALGQRAAVPVKPPQPAEEWVTFQFVK